MHDIQNQESPLIQFWKRPRASQQASQIGVQLQELGLAGFVNVRGNPACAGFLEGAQSALGIALPLAPNSIDAARKLGLLRLGPDEWLITTPPGQEHRITASLREQLADQICSVTDVTSGFTTLELSGPEAEITLAKGCSVDLDLVAFPVGRCLQTNVAKTNVIILRVENGLFFLIVRRNFAEYLAVWIEQAGQEFGFAAISDVDQSLQQQEIAVAGEK
jgi:sarcosine oxidase subunit gamma